MPPDVYAAGWDIVGDLYKAVYWKNGVETTLDSGSYGARAFGIAVVNGNVYVAGFEGSATGNDIAVVWTNGVARTLQDDSHYSVGYAIAVSGTDVYVAGTDRAGQDGPTAPVYWKNGVETTLELAGIPENATGMGGLANSIVVDASGNVYVGGDAELNSRVSENTYYQSAVAGYWKNGTLVLLGNPLTFSQTYGIAVNGNDVYAAGSACAVPASEPPPPDCSVATYWKNGSAVTQTPALLSVYGGIAVSGTSVYLPDNVDASSILSSGNLAELSTNGSLTQLSTSTQAAANCVFLYGTDVYVGGAANSAAGYWKNGTLVSLPDPGQATVISIDVVTAGTATL